MFLHRWAGIGRTAVVGVCAYSALVLLLRLPGKRPTTGCPQEDSP